MNTKLPKTDFQNGSFAPAITVKRQEGEREVNQNFVKSFRIGRDESCEVRIVDGLVSRFHAEVKFVDGHWWINDLNSTNGLYIEGNKIEKAALIRETKIVLGNNGPALFFIPQGESQKEKTLAEQKAPSMTQYYEHYFSDKGQAGEHTMMIRRTFQVIQKKQRSKYAIIIAAIAILLVTVTAVAIFQRIQSQKHKLLAQEIFYNMQVLKLQIAHLEEAFKSNAGPKALAEIKNIRQKRIELEQTYDRYIKDLGIYKKSLSEEDRIILRIARIFGECEINMPPGFVTEVKKYIRMWQTTDRFSKALKRAENNQYIPKIVTEMLGQDLPPQFMYIALQESDFDVNTCGPMTHSGIAKGVWQFIPETAMTYDLKVGPLYLLRRPDPRDDRHHFERSTEAAARYLRDIYTTEAQASGLLVIASYNWGEHNIRNLIRKLPENPKERNFWKLLEKYRDRIPEETYNYVFYIISAAVIGEKPQLFGIKVDNPLAKVETLLNPN